MKSERWSVPQAIDFTEATETPSMPTMTKGPNFERANCCDQGVTSEKGAVVSCIASKDTSKPVAIAQHQRQLANIWIQGVKPQCQTSLCNSLFRLIGFVYVHYLIMPQ